jgi:two-component system, NtrC family, response regulator AtoC
MGNLQPPMLSIAVTLLDRNRESCERIRIALLGLGFRVSVVHSEAQAIEAAGTSVLIISGGPPEWQVYATRQVLSEKPLAVVIVLAGEGDPRTAVEVMKAGAIDYLTQPYSMEQLRRTLIHAAERVNSAAALEEIRRSFAMKAQMRLEGMVAHSPAMEKLFRIIPKVANSDHPALILGESGTGKELVARAIHYRGVYAKRPFIAVDCGSLVPTLIESELFGYEKGAFTGANRSKEGLFQAASGGTIFLDEIGELPLEMQAKLLRVLQEKEVRPVGRNDKVKVDVRVIAATNRDLEVAYKEGTFRKDLYCRLNVVTVHLPSLRERKSDIPTLVHWFLNKYAPQQMLEVTSSAMQAMLQYEWPGNIRELENCIERGVALGADRLFDVDDLPPAIHNGGAAASQVINVSGATSASKMTATDLEELERATIERVFQQVNGDKQLAGKMLGISRATLYRKLKRYGIGERSMTARA